VQKTRRTTVGYWPMVPLYTHHLTKSAETATITPISKKKYGPVKMLLTPTYNSDVVAQKRSSDMK